MKRTLKKFIKIIPSIICIIFLSFFILMANGYGILKRRLNISGETSINVENNEEILKPEVEFKKTKQMGDYIYFYDIIIYNKSDKNYYNWQVKINDTEYISYPFSIDGERIDGGWILNNYNWDDRIEAGEKVNVTIIFEVSSEIPSTILIEEYVQNFLNNSIEITCSSKEDNEGGVIIKNGNARLTLKETEIEIENFNVRIDPNYQVENPNEKMYIVTINNDTNNDYLIIRGNIYLGSNNKMLEVSPSVITCEHLTNTTFNLPLWIQVPKGTSLEIYIMINTKEDNFMPDIVLSATI